MFIGSMTAPVAHATTNGLTTVYHVYVDEQYIGEINDRLIVDNLIEEKLDKEAGQSINLVIDEEITYIIEKTFNPNNENTQVKNRLKELLTVKAEAYELKIGDEILGYFATEEQINEMITKYQKSYINEEYREDFQLILDNEVSFKEVIDIEDMNKQINESKKLSLDESKLTSVILAEDIQVTDKNISVDEMMTVKEGLTILKKGTLEDKKHTISEGEVLGEIANEYDLSTKQLLKLNPSITEESVLQIGQELNVTEQKPFVDVIVTEEEKVKEKISYKTKVIESDKMYKGEEKVKQKGKDGKKTVHYEIEKTNGKETDRKVLDEKVTKKPTKKVIVKGTKVIPSRGSGELTWPTNGGYISSNYGYRWGRLHKGIDIARSSNRTIKAADHGVVSFAGYKRGYGNKIIINHNNGMRTLYAHLSSINVRVGQTIEKGSQIGVMGSTGNSTGIHLHFEVHQNGGTQNPLRFY